MQEQLFIMEDLKTTQIKNYIATAREFCNYIEKTGSARPVELLTAMQNLLANVYAQTALIKKPKYCYEEEPQKFVHENEYAAVHDKLQSIIEKFDGSYSIKMKNKTMGMDILSFSLAESITDIYKELKDCYRLYEIGLSQPMNDAIWSCRDSFEKYWGLQLIETLQSIHQLLFGHQLTSNQLRFDNINDESDENWFSEEDDITYDEE